MEGFKLRSKEIHRWWGLRLRNHTGGRQLNQPQLPNHTGGGQLDQPQSLDDLIMLIEGGSKIKEDAIPPGSNAGEFGRLAGLGSGPEGADRKLEIGYTQDEIQAMKDAGYTKENIKAWKELYILVDKTLKNKPKPSTVGTPGTRVKLMELILELW